MLQRVGHAALMVIEAGVLQRGRRARGKVGEERPVARERGRDAGHTEHAEDTLARAEREQRHVAVDLRLGGQREAAARAEQRLDPVGVADRQRLGFLGALVAEVDPRPARRIRDEQLGQALGPLGQRADLVQAAADVGQQRHPLASSLLAAARLEQLALVGGALGGIEEGRAHEPRLARRRRA